MLITEGEKKKHVTKPSRSNGTSQDTSDLIRK